MITNGYLLSERLVKGRNDAGLTHLQISIDGVTPNATTVKVLRPLRAKLLHLERHARFRVQVNAVLGAGNDEEVLEVMRYAADAGFIPRASILHDGRGAMALDERGRAIMAEVCALVGKRWEESGDYRARLIATGAADFKCRAGSRYLYIDEHGMSGGPSGSRTPVADCHRRAPERPCGGFRSCAEPTSRLQLLPLLRRLPVGGRARWGGKEQGEQECGHQEDRGSHEQSLETAASVFVSGRR